MTKLARQIAVAIERTRDLRYAAMVEAMRAGHRFPWWDIQDILRDAQKTETDLIHAVLVDENQRGHVLPGDPCQQCGRGWLITYCTKRRKNGSRTRYLHCAVCKSRPPNNKHTVGQVE